MSDAAREANWRCKDTCSVVEKAVGDAIWDTIARSDWLCEGIDITTVSNHLTEVAFNAAKHHGTEKLRAALIEAEGERLTAQSDLVDAQYEITRLKVDLDSMTDERDEVRRELEQAREEIERLNSISAPTE